MSLIGFRIHLHPFQVGKNVTIPTNLLHGDLWKMTIDEKMASLIENEIWDLSDDRKTYWVQMVV